MKINSIKSIDYKNLEEYNNILNAYKSATVRCEKNQLCESKGVRNKVEYIIKKNNKLRQENKYKRIKEKIFPNKQFELQLCVKLVTDENKHCPPVKEKLIIKNSKEIKN